MSENELNANQQKADSQKTPKLWDNRWNVNLVQARLSKNVYLRLGHFKRSFKPRKNTSEALNFILNEFLPPLPQKSND